MYNFLTIRKVNILYLFNIYLCIVLYVKFLKRNNMDNATKKSKAVTFTLNAEVLKTLKKLAEKNSNSLSYEVRRLIQDEYKRTTTGS